MKRPLAALRLLLILGVLLGLASCAVNPVTGRQEFVMMSESQELALGRRGDADVRKEYGVYASPELQRYVNEVGQKLARVSHRPDIAYHFTVLDSPEVNAFALPGGYIYIFRGIIAYLNSEAELAAVLGHELGHVTARHAVEQYTAAQAANIGVAIGSVFLPELRTNVGQNVVNVLGTALLAGYGREHELEADRLGAEYLARSGYDPQAMIGVLKVLKAQEEFDAQIAKQEGREPNHYHGLFATHPDNDTRLKQVVAEADRFVRAGSFEGRAEFLKHIDGMVFGDSPQQGIVRGSQFFHPELGFALTFPADWRIVNQPNKVIAKSPGGVAAMELTLAGRPQGTPADLLRQRFRLGFGSELEARTINGLPAAVAGLSRGGRPLRAAAIYLDDKAFLIVGGAASAAAFASALPEINRSMESFHALTPAERETARPLTLKVITALPGTTFAQLAKSSPLGKNAEGYLRLLNDKYPKGEPAPGKPLKIVE